MSHGLVFGCRAIYNGVEFWRTRQAVHGHGNS